MLSLCLYYDLYGGQSCGSVGRVVASDTKAGMGPLKTLLGALVWYPAPDIRWLIFHIKVFANCKIESMFDAYLELKEAEAPILPKMARWSTA